VRRKPSSTKDLALCKKERQTGRNDPPLNTATMYLPSPPPIPSVCSSFFPKQTNKQFPIPNCRYSISHPSLIPPLKPRFIKMPSPTHQPTQQSRPVQQVSEELSSIADLAIGSLSLSAPAPSCACTSNWQHSYFNCTFPSPFSDSKLQIPGATTKLTSRQIQRNAPNQHPRRQR
jgi:hypothetical protein